MSDKLTRRQFIRDSAVAGAAIGAGISLSDSLGAVDSGKILNYNSDMEYRRCGRTGLMVSRHTTGLILRKSLKSTPSRLRSS